jgi:hypothetical protein
MAEITEVPGTPPFEATKGGFGNPTIVVPGGAVKSALAQAARAARSARDVTTALVRLTAPP